MSCVLVDLIIFVLKKLFLRIGLFYNMSSNDTFNAKELLSPTSTFLSKFMSRMAETEKRYLGGGGGGSFPESVNNGYASKTQSASTSPLNSTTSFSEASAAQSKDESAASMRLRGLLAPHEPEPSMSMTSSSLAGQNMFSNFPPSLPSSSTSSLPKRQLPPSDSKSDAGGDATFPTLSGILLRAGAPNLAASLQMRNSPPHHNHQSRPTTTGSFQMESPGDAAEAAPNAADFRSSAALNNLSSFSQISSLNNSQFHHQGSQSPLVHAVTSTDSHDTSQAQIRSLLATLQTMTDETNRVQKAHAFMQRELAAAQTELDAMTSRAIDAEANTKMLERERVKLQAQEKRLADGDRQRIKDLEWQISADKNAHEIKVKEFETELAASKQALLAAQEELTGAKRAVAAAQVSLMSGAADNEHALSLLRLERDKASLQRELALLKNELMTVRAKFQAAEEREKQKSIAIDAVAIAERERDDARAQLASTREAHARQQAASQQTVMDFQRAVSSQASKLASMREELSTSESERRAERNHFDQRLEEAEKRFSTVSRAFEQLEADAKAKESDRAIKDAVNAAENDTKSHSGVFAYATRLEQEIGTLRRNAAALKMALCLQRMAAKRMRPVFNSFHRGNTSNSSHEYEERPDDYASGGFERLASTPMQAYGRSQTQHHQHSSRSSVPPAYPAMSISYVGSSARNTRPPQLPAAPQNGHNVLSELQYTAQAESSFQRSIKAANERAEKSENDAARAEKAASDAQLRLQLLQAAASQLLSSIGAPLRLSSSQSDAPANAKTSSAGASSSSPPPHSSSSSKLSMFFTALSPQATGNSASSTGLSSPVAAVSSPSGGSDFGVAVSATKTVTPEAVTLAAVQVSAMRQQLDSLRFFVFQLVPDAAQAASKASAAAGEGYGGGSGGSEFDSTEIDLDLSILDSPTKTSLSSAKVSAFAKVGSLSLRSALVRAADAVDAGLTHLTSSKPYPTANIEDLRRARRLALSSLNVHAEKLAIAETSSSFLRASEAEADRAKQHSRQQIAELHATLSTTTSAKNRAEATVSQLFKQLETLKTEHEHCAASLHKAREETEAIRIEMAKNIEDRCSRLERDLETAERDLLNERSRASAAEAALLDATETISTARQISSAAMESQVKLDEALRKAKEDLVSEKTRALEELELISSQLQDDMAVALAGQQARNDSEFNRYKLAQEAAMSDLKESNARDIATILQNHESNIQSLVEAHKAAMVENDASHNATMNALMDGTESRIAALAAQRDESAQLLSEALRSVQKAIDLDIDNAALRDRIEKVTHSEDDLKVRLAQAQGESAGLRDRVLKIGEALTHVTNELERQTYEAMSMKAMADDARAKADMDKEAWEEEKQNLGFALAAAEDRAAAALSLRK